MFLICIFCGCFLVVCFFVVVFFVLLLLVVVVQEIFVVKDLVVFDILQVIVQCCVENVKDVLVVVSVIQGEKLDVFGLVGDDICFLVVCVFSFNIELFYGCVFLCFYIRGLGNIDFDFNVLQLVLLVYDDVVQESLLLKGFLLFDLVNVEVLCGLQGILFGCNMLVGVVKFDLV